MAARPVDDGPSLVVVALALVVCLELAALTESGWPLWGRLLCGLAIWGVVTIAGAFVGFLRFAAWH